MVGNIPNFTKIDILKCFLRFNKSLSRQELAKEIGLGEGTVRTIFNILKSKKLVSSTKKGHFLSEKGSKELSQIYSSISMPKKITSKNIYPDFKKVAVLIKEVQNLRELYKLRDIAVKNGAEGAIILKFEKRLIAPDTGYEQDYSELEECFDFKYNDIVAVAFSNESKYAEAGALAIAVEMSSPLKKFINELGK